MPERPRSGSTTLMQSHERGPGRTAASFDAAQWLSLAAAPVFAMMALLTVVQGGDPANIVCSVAHGSSPLSGMTPMYLLMSAFHSAPWLRWISSRRKGGEERLKA
jgi:hypothetical protein